MGFGLPFRLGSLSRVMKVKPVARVVFPWFS